VTDPSGAAVANAQITVTDVGKQTSRIVTTDSDGFYMAPSETFNIQFRAEFFNVINHGNFETPVDNTQIFDNTGALTSGAGAIDSLATSARQIQFGLKIIW
jgi:hypothetical protein